MDLFADCISPEEIASAEHERKDGYRLGRAWARFRAQTAALQAIVRIESDEAAERICAVPMAVLADPELSRLDCEDFWEQVSRQPNRSEAFATGFALGAAEVGRRRGRLAS